jgi:protocatechuate 3,4-dioxygenase beta subunit
MNTSPLRGFLLTLAMVCAAATAMGRATVAQQPPQPRDVRPAPQPPRDSASPQLAATGKGSISGVVTVAGSGQPARRARVTLSGTGEAGGSRTTLSDDQGRFAFNALPAARFTLSASKTGHLAAQYGQRRPGRQGTPIQLADGQRLQVQLSMWRGSVITGTVLDENAEAVPGTPVRALRYVMQSGQRTLQSSGSGQTDDRGVYRIYGLQPGDYVVNATPRNTGATADAERIHAEVQALTTRMQAIPADRAAESQALMERLSSLRTMVPPSDEPASGYAPVYYPGTSSPSSAATIVLNPGEEKSGIDFQYQVVPVARIEGFVTGGQVPQGITVMLVNAGFDVPGANPGNARTDAQGAFRFSNVPPGQYTIVARGTAGNPGREGGPGGRGPAPAPGRAMAMARGNTQAIRLWASTDVVVDGRNLSNVVLALQPGMSVAGRLTFEGSLPPPTDLTRARVTATPIAMPGGGGEMLQSSAGTVDADGRFTIASVVPGRYRITASVPNSSSGGAPMAIVPSGGGMGWSLGSSMVDGQDSLDFPIEIKPNQSLTNVVLTFVDRQSELTGTIVDQRSQPVLDYNLIVYPADQRWWTPQSRRIQSTRPATDGRFTFRNLPPGDYRIAPVLDPEPGSWYDPAFLQQLDGTATRVSIAEGEKKEQTLRVAVGG